MVTYPGLTGIHHKGVYRHRRAHPGKRALVKIDYLFQVNNGSRL